MGIERQDDFADPGEMAVEELAEPPGILDRAEPRPPADEKLPAGQAEGVLAVHQQESDPRRIAGGGPKPVRSGEGECLGGPVLVRHPVKLADALGVEEIGEGKRVRHGAGLPVQSGGGSPVLPAGGGTGLG